MCGSCPCCKSVLRFCKACVDNLLIVRSQITSFGTSQPFPIDHHAIFRDDYIPIYPAPPHPNQPETSILHYNGGIEERNAWLCLREAFWIPFENLSEKWEGMKWLDFPSALKVKNRIWYLLTIYPGGDEHFVNFSSHWNTTLRLPVERAPSRRSPFVDGVLSHCIRSSQDTLQLVSESQQRQSESVHNPAQTQRSSRMNSLNESSLGPQAKQSKPKVAGMSPGKRSRRDRRVHPVEQYRRSDVARAKRPVPPNESASRARHNGRSEDRGARCREVSRSDAGQRKEQEAKKRLALVERWLCAAAIEASLNNDFDVNDYLLWYYGGGLGAEAMIPAA